MSIIVNNEETNEIILYTKGADSAILPLINHKISRNINETKAALTEYAKIGLRTLLLAKRNIDLEEYQQWKKRYDVNFFFF